MHPNRNQSDRALEVTNCKDEFAAVKENYFVLQNYKVNRFYEIMNISDMNEPMNDFNFFDSPAIICMVEMGSDTDSAVFSTGMAFAIVKVAEARRGN